MAPTAPHQTVEIELGGKTRALRLTLHSLVVLKKDLGIDLMKNPQAALEGIAIEQIEGFLWAFLRHEDPDLTPEQVGEMVDITDIPRIVDKIGELFDIALPDKDSEGNPSGAGATGASGGSS